MPRKRKLTYYKDIRKPIADKNISADELIVDEDVHEVENEVSTKFLRNILPENTVTATNVDINSVQIENQVELDIIADNTAPMDVLFLGEPSPIIEPPCRVLSYNADIESVPIGNIGILDRIELYVAPLDIGDMTDVCGFCGALHFKQEKPRDNKYLNCCHKQRIKLQTFDEYPRLLKNLISNQHPLSLEFLNNIRSYNSALAFASMGANLQHHNSAGPYCYTIHGQIYHTTSNSLVTNNSALPRYAQLYILDTAEATNHRMNHNSNQNCNQNLLMELDTLLRQINKYAEGIKMLHEVEKEEQERARSLNLEVRQLSLRILSNNVTDRRRYNLPTSDEIAIVFEDSNGEPPFNRDLKIHYRHNQETQQLSIVNPNLDPMLYPILFPHAEPGWSDNRQLPEGKRMTMLQFYSYRLSVRYAFNPILYGGKLMQQYVVDGYTKIEANRLNFIRYNQKSLRVETYKGLQDFLLQDHRDPGEKAGVPVILPSSFTGSPRCMQQYYQDAMALVAKFGRPDLFITMTCNPKWPEISRNIYPHQTANNRPDIVSRVFEIKRKQLLNDIVKGELFGPVVAHVFVIEFQKRGLPHMHALFILQENHKFRTAEDIDKVVSAEIPSENNLNLRQLVLQHMIHGPCGPNTSSPCMDNGNCTKKFPKPVQTETNVNINGYPLYKRGECNIVHKGREINNGFVVPYNPYLLQKYCCHINVEICASIKSIKYLFKYVYKGHDCANVALQNRDEIEIYLNTRYVSAPESIYRINECKLHDISHAIIRLAVHLPESFPILFAVGEEEQALAQNARRHTTLTEWFKLNTLWFSARQYLYIEIPYHFVFGADKDKTWKPRIQGFNKVLSRMYTVTPRDIERYHLRLLLLNVRGARSFEDLRTVDGITYNTFKEAATALNLIETDEEYRKSLQEASLFTMPKQLRELFAYICVFCNPNEPFRLWEEFEEQLCEDYLQNNSILIARRYAAYDMEIIFLNNGRRGYDFDLPEPLEPPSRLIQHESDHTVDQRIASFNQDQLRVFDSVLLAIRDNSVTQRYFFVDGVGGSGKTYMFNTLISLLNRNRQNVCAVASTGIASTLLINGRTYFSAFGFPVPLFENSVSYIKHQTPQAAFLKALDLIIWDEVTMAPHFALSVLDRLLRDLCDSNLPFAGKTILIAGDFRQTLPIVKHGTKTDIVQSCIKFSSLWRYFKIIRLTINQRAATDIEYSNWVLSIGNGDHPRISECFSDDTVRIPKRFITSNLIDDVFGESVDFTQVNNAILCPKNEHANKINLEILNRLDQPLSIYLSIDTVMSDEESDIVNFPTEFLNSLTPSGLPQHQLHLKVGSVIMLLRNLNTKENLCNGTRLVIRTLRPHVLVAEIVTGMGKGKVVFLPRIALVPSDVEVPVRFRRRQFPVKLAWSMTINKSQGQTLDNVGLFLPEPVFGHGQLYVALSRVKTSDNIKIQILDTTSQGLLPDLDGFTKNCVYKEVL